MEFLRQLSAFSPSMHLIGLTLILATCAVLFLRNETDPDSRVVQFLHPQHLVLTQSLFVDLVILQALTTASAPPSSSLRQAQALMSASFSLVTNTI